MSQTNQQRALIALVQVLGLSVWFSATAVVPSLRSEWGLGSAAAVWLTASVQIGFVTGAVISALLNLADRTRPEYLLTASALCAATCTAALALCVNGIHSAIPLRFLTGMFLAGVYPVGMKLMASWSGSAERGRSFGILLGALTLGSALPHLIGGLGPLPWRTVMLTAAALAATAAAVAQGSSGQVHIWRPARSHRIRGARWWCSPNAGHGWPASVTSGTCGSSTRCGHGCRSSFGPGEDATRRHADGVIAFVAPGVAGTAGCLLGGWASDRFGRSPAAAVALTISGACCVASPIFFSTSTAVLIVFLSVWGAGHRRLGRLLHGPVRDHGRPVRRHRPDRADRLGFLLTVVSIQLVPVVADQIGWQYAFVLLAPGPLLGAVAMSALGTRQHHPQPEEETMTSCSTSPTICRSDRRAVTHHR